LARITPFPYKGKVWCVRVPTGAFVARRNGKVFITGNSGFPKAQDVSKLIDKEMGAERAKVGQGRGRTGATAQTNGGSTFSDDNYQWPGEFDITAPGSPISAPWSGHKTPALKPAHEIIVLARAPLTSTSDYATLVHKITEVLCQLVNDADCQQRQGGGGIGPNAQLSENELMDESLPSAGGGSV